MEPTNPQNSNPQTDNNVNNTPAEPSVVSPGAQSTPVSDPSPAPPAVQPTSSPTIDQAAVPEPSPSPQQPMAPAPSNKSKKGLMLIVLVVVIVLAGAVTAYLLMHKTKNTTNNSTNTNKSVNTTTTSTSKTCTSESCFDPDFKNCTPSTLNATNALGGVHYQIYGAKDSACSMLFEYTQNPNAAWQNKPMTCDFNNKVSLDTSVQDVFNNLLAKSNTYNCTGPLVAILQAE